MHDRVLPSALTSQLIYMQYAYSRFITKHSHITITRRPLILPKSSHAEPSLQPHWNTTYIEMGGLGMGGLGGGGLLSDLLSGGVGYLMGKNRLRTSSNRRPNTNSLQHSINNTATIPTVCATVSALSLAGISRQHTRQQAGTTQTTRPVA
jgi:hypothetical protein